jgi:hypothetical protein
MADIQMIKQDYVVNINNLNFKVNSFSTEINMDYKIDVVINKSFYAEYNGVSPFLLILKGCFLAETDLILPLLFNMMKTNLLFNLELKGSRFRTSRLVGVNFSENIKETFSECELKVLVINGVEAMV